MKSIQNIVVIPVGPTCQFKFVLDTIESVYYYLNSVQVIIVDDSHNEMGKKLLGIFSDLVLLETLGNNGKDAGLYYTLSDGFRYAIENYKFKLLFRIDTDALFIGEGIDEDAIKFFNDHPNIGLLGAYKYGADGKLRDIAWNQKQFKWETGLYFSLRWFTRRNGITTYKELYRRARDNGYTLGENVMGGACIYSYQAVKALYDGNLLPVSGIEWSILQEDFIFSLLLSSKGVEMGDFSYNDFPMATKWRGLPASPEKLSQQGKKLIHSTRFYKEMDEQKIRNYFEAMRK